MTKIVTPWGHFRLVRIENEGEFERAIVEHAHVIFGSRRIYIDCKRRVGKRGGKQIIPDGYLIDFSRYRDPQLVVVENELSSHDLFRHIGVQLLQYAVSFPEAARQVKSVLHEEISEDQELENACLEYAHEAGLRNLDHLLDYIVVDKPFQAIVIIDEVTDDLQNVLNNLAASPEVIEFKTYENENGERIYRFEPYLGDVEESIRQTTLPPLDPSEIDTVVVPAREEGFREVFIGENRWHAVRIHVNVRPQLKYIAAYRIRPLSAITHIAPIYSIERWKDTSKVVVNFAEPASEINHIKLVPNGKVNAPQSLRYTSMGRLMAASNLDEVF
jgi:hypothetical protein